MSTSTVSRPTGIDVGGAEKGFHAVLLQPDGCVEKCQSACAEEIAEWCVSCGATIIGVDAPSGWSSGDKSREAERTLNEEGIHCFYTPSQSVAAAHQADNYGWVFNGQKMYAALRASFPLFDGKSTRPPLSFETFPHAIARILGGNQMVASKKRTQRTNLLLNHGVDTQSLTNQDWIDAAMCALAARSVVEGKYRKIGNADEGFIVVPQLKLDADELERVAQGILGAIIFQFSKLEFQIGIQLRELVAGRDIELLNPVVDRLTFKAKLDALKDVVERRFSTDAMKVEEFRQWHRGADEFRARRNKFIHGRWGIYPHEGQVINVSPGMPGDSPQSETKYEVEQLRHELLSLEKLCAEFAAMHRNW